jgi:N-acetylmuramic acid 6-phosphate (MurNAc-6-P) etherase
MNSGSTVLSVLREARELLASGKTPCIISAISSLKEQSSGRTRDLAYFAVMETMMLDGAETTISLLAQPENQANALRMIEATIKRLTSTVH